MVKSKKKKSTKKTPAKKKVNKKKQKISFFWIFCRWTIILTLWAGIFVGLTLIWFAKDLPDITQSATFERRSSIVIKASDNSIIARYGEMKGSNIFVDELPVHLINAVLAIEDRRFYRHPGIDILGISRAMLVNITKGRFVQGGSTITQQLAKNLFLTHERKITRKIKEALLALWLEKELSKDEILSAYMNRVYLGSGTYGFEAASLLYFNKHAKDVNLREAAILAGLLKAPSRYSPHNNLELAKKRSDIVISSMKAAGYIDDNDITASNLSISLPHKTSRNGQGVRYFTDWIIDGLDEIIGRPDIDIVIETTLDSNLQKQAQKILKDTIDSADPDKFLSQGGILAMRPDGAILSMVGGYDYAQSQFNRTTQARRPPGSAFKPIIYLSAIEKGWHANSRILDAPITTGDYRPKNFAGKYYGKTNLKDALTKSMNTATLRLTKEIGISSVLKTAKKLGIFSKLERDFSLSLGSSGISMLEMATAYAVLANGGYRVFPYAITRIIDKDGNILFSRHTATSYQSIVRTKHVREISSMMENVINEGTGRRARLPFAAAGKTGTSQNSRDAWFAGYSNKMISVVWLGNDDNSPMRNVTGGSVPAEIWREIMLYGNARNNTLKFKDNSGGISGLLGRLIPNSNSIVKHDYSNVND